MALNISIRSGQFGDDQLTSDHFSSTTQYASFLVDSALTNGNAAVANIADLTALESTIQTAIDSDIDARLGSLVSILGAGITYDAANDTFAFGAINLTSSAAPVAPATLTDWTSVIEAIDTALKTAETDIATNAGNIATNTGNIATNTADIATNVGNIADLRGDVNATLGLTVANPSGITGFVGTNYLTAPSITSVKGAIEELDSALNTIEQTLLTADLGLQANIDTLESNVESRLGISDITDANAFKIGSSNYLQAATDVSNALTILDAAIESNATDIATNLASIGALDTRLTTAEGNISSNTTNIGNLQIELDATQTSLGFTNSTYTSGGTNHATTNNVTTDITALDTAITAVESAVSGLGDAFNYVNATSIDPQNVATAASSDPNATLATRTAWTAGNQFQDLSILTEKDTGDYYKVATSGWVSYDGTGANTVWVNQYDGVVWNSTSSVDKIDNTNSEVQVTGDLTITGSADSGFNISSATIDGKVATNASDITSLQTFTGEGTALDTTAVDLAAAINELLGEIVANDGDIAGLDTDLTALTGRVTTNEGDIATNATNIGTNAGNIATNTTNIGTNTTSIATNASDIASNDTDISALQANQLAIETSVGLPASGTKTDFDSGNPDPANNTYNITAGGSFKTAIEELDAAVQQSSTAPVDTGRLTVAPVSHQYADFARLNDVNDLQAYASKVYDANATNTSGTNTNGYGDLHEFRIPTVAGKQILVLGSLLANAPTPTVPANSGDSSHLNNNTYWSSVRVYKNGVRLIQRNSSATLQSADEYKVVAVINPANYPATYGDYDTSDEFVRYPIKYGAEVESSWRATVSSLTIGNTDPNAGDSHTLAGQTNTDDTSATAHPKSGAAHPNAGEVRYYKVEFGDVLNTQDIITVDYMGLKD